MNIIVLWVDYSPFKFYWNLMVLHSQRVIFEFHLKWYSLTSFEPSRIWCRWTCHIYKNINFFGQSADSFDWTMKLNHFCLKTKETFWFQLKWCGKGSLLNTHSFLFPLIRFYFLWKTMHSLFLFFWNQPDFHSTEFSKI